MTSIHEFLHIYKFDKCTFDSKILRSFLELHIMNKQVSQKDKGLFKVNLEFRISGVNWKMIHQFVLETGN